jgi:hypothetical protein
MAQLSYSASMATAFAGMKADSRFDLVESAVAYLAVAFGRAVANEPGSDDVHIPVLDVSKVTFSADFSSSNVITVTINGVACSPVTYASNHATTATALLAAIAAHPAVTASSKNSAGRIYTIETKGIAISASGIVAGGSAVTVTAEQLTGANDVFRGISIHRHNELGLYSAKEVIDIMRQGEIWVDTAVQVTSDETAYVDMAGGVGKFTNVSTNNMATGGKFRSSNTGAGLAKVEINLP